jgi:hypothetical protein
LASMDSASMVSVAWALPAKDSAVSTAKRASETRPAAQLHISSLPFSH